LSGVSNTSLLNPSVVIGTHEKREHSKISSIADNSSLEPLQGRGAWEDLRQLKSSLSERVWRSSLPFKIGSQEGDAMLPTKTLALVLLTLLAPFINVPQTQASSTKAFDQQGLSFEYFSSWELSGQPTGEVQQLVLAEKALDAQIMIISQRASVTSPKEEETAKQNIVDAMVTRVMKQYEAAGIKVERAEMTNDIAGVTAKGFQLRFAVDQQPGSMDVSWLVLNQRFIAIIFLRPEKTASQSILCLDLIRQTLKIHKF
jgi:hypothetical protein